MAKYTARYVNTISLIISIIVFCLINNFNFDIQSVKFKASFNVDDSKNFSQDLKKNSNSVNEVTNESDIYTKDENVVNGNWYIEIPSISLKAEILEGTSSIVMEKFVGHFEDTSKTFGNVGLAAHNRGYENNYFANLKKLKEGEEILYNYNDFQKLYVVVKHEIIKDTDWSKLENTDTNIITLITCVENEPEYRRCIQGIEKN